MLDSDFPHIHSTILELALMAKLAETKDAPQSGAKVGLGVLGFIVGIFLLLWIVKIVFKF
jgi:hypothetical protein